MTTTANSPFPTSSASPASPAPTSTNGSNGSNGSNGQSPVAKVEGEGGAVLGRVVQGAHSAIDRIAETAGPAVQKLQDGVSAAGDALSQRAADARELGDEWVESLRGSVREHPLASLATALAVGVLIARLAR